MASVSPTISSRMASGRLAPRAATKARAARSCSPVSTSGRYCSSVWMSRPREKRWLAASASGPSGGCSASVSASVGVRPSRDGASNSGEALMLGDASDAQSGSGGGAIAAWTCGDLRREHRRLVLEPAHRPAVIAFDLGQQAPPIRWPRARTSTPRAAPSGRASRRHRAGRGRGSWRRRAGGDTRRSRPCAPRPWPRR